MPPRATSHALVVLVCTLGCASGPAYGPPAAPVSEPKALCSTAHRGGCRSAEDVERRLASAELELLGATGSPGGTQGAYVLTLRDRRDGVVLRAKWRAEQASGLVNVPHRELGAYHVQKLFLEPREQVVPPTVVRCLPLDAYREHVDPEAAPTEGTRCVLGYLSYWLEEAISVDDARDEGMLSSGEGLYDPDRFERDEVYRASLADLNLLSHLCRHGDAHRGQFVFVSHGPHLVSYSVDHSIAFEAVPNPMLLFRKDWSELQLPSLSAASVERLRAVSTEDLAALHTIAELERRDGMLVPTEPTEAFGDGDDAFRMRGDRVQVGLKTGEIEGVAERIAELLARVERGELETH